MADALKAEFGFEHVELISGKRGEFTVWLDEQCIARKSFSGFPSEAEALKSMKEALAKRG